MNIHSRIFSGVAMIAALLLSACSLIKKEEVALETMDLIAAAAVVTSPSAPGAPGAGNPGAGSNPNSFATLQSKIAVCIACHSGGTPKALFDITSRTQIMTGTPGAAAGTSFVTQPCTAGSSSTSALWQVTQAGGSGGVTLTKMLTSASLPTEAAAIATWIDNGCQN